MNIAGSAVSLRGLPLFCLLTDAELASVQPLTQLRNYAADAEIVKPGDTVDGIYLLLAGTVNVLLQDSRGHKIIVDTLCENDTFSELSLFESHPNRLTFVCARPSQVLYVPREGLTDALHHNCNVASFVATALARRLEHSYRKLSTLAHDDVYARVLDVLLAHGHDKDGAWHVDVGAEAMSTMVGASREMVSRVTKDLVQRGLVRRHKRRLVADDRSALHQWALQRRAAPQKRKRLVLAAKLPDPTPVAAYAVTAET